MSSAALDFYFYFLCTYSMDKFTHKYGINFFILELIGKVILLNDHCASRLLPQPQNLPVSL